MAFEVQAKVLTPKDVAHILGVSEGTLRNWRQRGKGPPYLKIDPTSNHARPRYELTMLVAWMQEPDLGDKSDIL